MVHKLCYLKCTATAPKLQIYLYLWYFFHVHPPLIVYSYFIFNLPNLATHTTAGEGGTMTPSHLAYHRGRGVPWPWVGGDPEPERYIINHEYEDMVLDTNYVLYIYIYIIHVSYIYTHMYHIYIYIYTCIIYIYTCIIFIYIHVSYINIYVYVSYIYINICICIIYIYTCIIYK